MFGGKPSAMVSGTDHFMIADLLIYEEVSSPDLRDARRVAAGRLEAPSVPDPASPEDVGEEHQRNESDGTVAEGPHDGEQLLPILAEDVPDQRVGHGPHDACGQVIGEKPVVFHPGNTGEEWGHATQARSEASDEDGLPTVRLEVAFHPDEALLVDQEMAETDFVGGVDRGSPADAPDPIHGVVGDEGPNEAA